MKCSRTASALSSGREGNAALGRGGMNYHSTVYMEGDEAYFKDALLRE